jgi:hypothetical protein
LPDPNLFLYAYVRREAVEETPDQGLVVLLCLRHVSLFLLD